MISEILKQTASLLATQPGHEQVRVGIARAMTDGLGASLSDLELEKPIPEVRGRTDALIGRTVFEFKKNLPRERAEAKEQLERYLRQRERETSQSYVGIATDGLLYEVYAIQSIGLMKLAEYRLKPENPHDWLAWLDSAVMLDAQIEPEPERVKKELGRGSIIHARSMQTIREVWQALREDSESQLKYRLWKDMLAVSYGAEVGDEDLFVQHTFLAIIAKTIAHLVLLETLPDNADSLLSGEGIRAQGIYGPVEHDFFSWVLKRPDGDELVLRIARQVQRFNLPAVQTDILKVLYESLIDPETRHVLGEYYTPDWLAERICDTAITDPNNQTILDPACGSGSFLFHAVRKALRATEAEGLPIQEAISSVTNRVIGVDIHPVAVMFASVTYLLAMIDHLRGNRPPEVHIPVFMGDSLQWEVTSFFGHERIEVKVPDGPTLEIPTTVAAQPRLFDAIVQTMLELGETDQPRSHFDSWLKRDFPQEDEDARQLGETYSSLAKLRREGRNHIWGYVLRHLARPLWLSRDDQKVDVIVGNPPWLVYNRMPLGAQERFQDECRRLGLWCGGTTATSQDLSAYFYVRAVEKYLKPGGTIAMVMPFAALSRGAYKKFRTGNFSTGGTDGVLFKFTEAWSFDSDVTPLFPVPSCTLFAEEGKSGLLPNTIRKFSGQISHRDARWEQAKMALTEVMAPMPGIEAHMVSPYKERFPNGATLYPRRLVLVEPQPTGLLGGNPEAPLMIGRVGNQDKKPWEAITPPKGIVENQFLRPVFLGENVLPFRSLEPLLGVIPWNEKTKELLDSSNAGKRGFRHLSKWLGRTEDIWNTHQRGNTPFLEQTDYFGKLTAQFPISPLRVVYTKAGKLLAAAIIRDSKAVIDHKLYWSRVDNQGEGEYLTAILNSETLRVMIAQYQSQGQWGARDFDKHIFKAPIPLFDPDDASHQALAEIARRATKIAEKVELKSGMHFIAARKKVRIALIKTGIAQEIEVQVQRLFKPFLPVPLRPKKAIEQRAPQASGHKKSLKTFTKS